MTTRGAEEANRDAWRRRVLAELEAIRKLLEKLATEDNPNE